jgi:hypothetical protein
MKPSDRMVHLTTVMGSFHGHVLAARLGTEGIPVELRGMSEGPYPLPANVSVFVREDQLELARSLLLADAVDAVFDERYNDLGPDDALALDLPPMDLPGPSHFRRAHKALVLSMVGLVLVLAFITSFITSFH